MTALVNAELLKLRTLRSTFWAAGALLAITVVVGTLLMNEAGTEGMRTAHALRDTLAAAEYTAVFFVVVLGALAAAGEYRHRTISQRFLATPARPRVLVAKLAAFAGVGAVTLLAVTALGAALSEAVVSGKGYTLDLGHAGARMAAGAALAGALAAMLGVTAGTLTRNPTTAVVAIFGIWMAEKVSGLLGPFTLLEAVLGLQGPLSLGLAALGLAAVVAVLALVAARVVLWRDVT
jgi:ABC-2 type transport system permease protein